MLGELLSGRARDTYVLATKVFFPMSDQDRGLSAAQIAKQMRTPRWRWPKVDQVDLYQCHRYDTETPLEETMAALTDVVKQGKARYIGFSEWRPEQIQAAIFSAPPQPFVSSQPQYSLLWRRPEQKVTPLCAANGISQIVWSPLAQGVLSGKYLLGAKPPAGSRATSDDMGGAMQNWLLSDPPGGGAGAEADRGGSRLHSHPVLAGLGAARAQHRLGHRRRQPPRPARRERRRLASRSARPCSPRPRRSSPIWSGCGRRARLS